MHNIENKNIHCNKLCLVHLKFHNFFHDIRNIYNNIYKHYSHSSFSVLNRYIYQIVAFCGTFTLSVLFTFCNVQHSGLLLCLQSTSCVKKRFSSTQTPSSPTHFHISPIHLAFLYLFFSRIRFIIYNASAPASSDTIANHLKIEKFKMTSSHKREMKEV